MEKTNKCGCVLGGGGVGGGAWGGKGWGRSGDKKPKKFRRGHRLGCKTWWFLREIGKGGRREKPNYRNKGN